MYDIVFPNHKEWQKDLESLVANWKYTVLYFYPKDNTPWCSIQAEEFSELIEEFNKKSVEVYWVSKDGIESHKKFIDKKWIKFPLISDPNFELHKKFWAYWEKTMFWKKYNWTIRSVIIVNEKLEIIESFINIKAKWSWQKTLDFINTLL